MRADTGRELEIFAGIRHVPPPSGEAIDTGTDGTSSTTLFDMIEEVELEATAETPL